MIPSGRGPPKGGLEMDPFWTHPGSVHHLGVLKWTHSGPLLGPSKLLCASCGFPLPSVPTTSCIPSCIPLWAYRWYHEVFTSCHGLIDPAPDPPKGVQKGSTPGFEGSDFRPYLETLPANKIPTVHSADNTPHVLLHTSTVFTLYVGFSLV